MRTGRRSWRTHKTLITAAIVVVACAAWVCSASAAPPAEQLPAGALDSGFAWGGVLTQAFGTAEDEFGRDAVLQPGGKIVVLTISNTADYLSRYLPSGELDTSFGTAGSVTLPGTGRDDGSVAVDPLDRVVVVGFDRDREWYSPPGSSEGELGLPRTDAVVYRFKPDGEPDVSFGTDGKATISVAPPEGLTPGSASTFPIAVTTTADSGIIVGGEVEAVCYWESSFGNGGGPLGESAHWWEEDGTFVARLNADGALDGQFGTDGVVATHGRCGVEPGVSPEGFDALAQTSPDSVVTLTNHPEDGAWRFRFYSPAGVLSEVSASAEGAMPRHMTVITNHELLVETLGTLREYTSAGILDRGFGVEGSILTNLACTSSSGCFAVAPDGRIVVTGAISAPYPKAGVKRYLPSGQVDNSFGNAPLPGGAGSAGEAWAQLTPQADELYIDKLLILNGQPLVIGAAIVNGSNDSHPQTALALFQANGGPSSDPLPELEENPPPPPGSPPEPPRNTQGAGIEHASATVDAGVSGGPAHGNVASVASSRSSAGFVLNLGRPPRIPALLKTGHYRLGFWAPGPGTVSIWWTTASRRVPLVVARGRAVVRAAGRGVITLQLSRAGRRSLKQSRLLRLRVAATFDPSAGRTAMRRGWIKLVR